MAGVHGNTHERLRKSLVRLKVVFLLEGNESFLHPTGLLQPLNIPVQVWAKVYMEFISGISGSRGKTVLFMVID